ncbi:hypothetical protein UNDYM_4279 [Undibacterium sp. YM2]|jgi:hypothetical protein|uniref:hypothetical protein n=1 Tax=Undibacterium sp. YM2 TaxID=2058625 RepID=UPI001331F852|nr:hypothetical protein [Undibacterium sp. YM2]BBB68532.1 hypothetical protein UNDYM_4279 [Undibacterium sp. YM2]
MFKFFLALALALHAVCASAAVKPYSADVSTWKEITVPASEEEREVWRYAANDSEIAWRVYTEGTIVKAKLDDHHSKKADRDTRFVIAAEPLSGFSKTSFTEVDDGWLVGYNRGEFGASLYWFSKDRKKHYKISDHQIIRFIQKSNALYAIEGLSHLGVSRGSLIKFIKHSGRWLASTEVKLPCAPNTASLKRNQELLLACPDALLAIDQDNFIHTLYKPFIQDGIWPISSVLSETEDYLYIGAVQYVIQVDLNSKQIRYLIPDESLLNKRSAK